MEEFLRKPGEHTWVPRWAGLPGVTTVGVSFVDFVIMPASQKPPALLPLQCWAHWLVAPCPSPNLITQLARELFDEFVPSCKHKPLLQCYPPLQVAPQDSKLSYA